MVIEGSEFINDYWNNNTVLGGTKMDKPKQTKKEQPQEKKVVVVKKKEMNIANSFNVCARTPYKSKTELIKSMMLLLGKYNYKKTPAGTPLTENIVSKQINAMLRDVKNGNGRWKPFKLVEEKGLFQLVPKQV